LQAHFLMWFSKPISIPQIPNCFLILYSFTNQSSLVWYPLNESTSRFLHHLKIFHLQDFSSTWRYFLFNIFLSFEDMLSSRFFLWNHITGAKSLYLTLKSLQVWLLLSQITIYIEWIAQFKFIISLYLTR
jgi:hypothetical protein